MGAAESKNRLRRSKHGDSATTKAGEAFSLFFVFKGLRPKVRVKWQIFDYLLSLKIEFG